MTRRSQIWEDPYHRVPRSCWNPSGSFTGAGAHSQSFRFNCSARTSDFLKASQGGSNVQPGLRTCSREAFQTEGTAKARAQRQE